MFRQACKYATAQTKILSEPLKPRSELMLAWQFQSFGGLDQLKLNNVILPQVKKPNDVLVKVHATSVNPLDVAMIGGYGNVVLDTLRQCDFRMENKNVPLTTGRDFCGEVVSKSTNVRKDIKVGDLVYGAIPPHYQGSHASYLVIDDHLMIQKPSNIKDTEAASIPYTALTAWSALKISGDLAVSDPKTKKVLVLGASGGVGTAAVQMLKAWGCQVVATCGTDAVSLVSNMSPDIVIDYQQKEAMREIELSGKYDIILDASGNVNYVSYVPYLKEWSNSKFITLKSPFLSNTDYYGLLGGLIKNASDLLKYNLSSNALAKGCTVRWGFFAPLGIGMTEIGQLVKTGQLKPKIDSTFSFEEMPKAFKKVSEGHLRGKVVVSHKKDL
ncbi:reticulon-4-interacting protein 1 homolog, mitochondrial [Halyomorpha halys]|uniref:reticulon-4-interacting protein 1 homolog, mitochondrial n=1 Tax=Halyomorpha halys TaxID=286706 RepID=UPI0006D4FA55|nr:reticulon-4-interacting protein 1 homolog, mitochondrial [Halyomorpha halys]